MALVLLLSTVLAGLTRYMMTQAFLSQKGAEKSNENLLKILNSLPDAVLLLKTCDSTEVMNKTIEEQNRALESSLQSIQCLQHKKLLQI